MEIFERLRLTFDITNEINFYLYNFKSQQYLFMLFSKAHSAKKKKLFSVT